MPEVAQYNLSYKELIELLIKENDVHEGLWSLSLGFQIGVGLQGPNQEQLSLGVAVSVNQIGIQRVPDGQPVTPGATVVDAKQINPSPKKKSK